ncbi:MAG TPA: hypothetical protein PLZ22_11095, partial [Thermotogota bacterium]|nr:hypothetical protein [Thermotogota bacterium]HPM22025.1 hypothetical protein [Thermotogota bacterium]
PYNGIIILREKTGVKSEFSPYQVNMLVFTILFASFLLIFNDFNLGIPANKVARASSLYRADCFESHSDETTIISKTEPSFRQRPFSLWYNLVL